MDAPAEPDRFPVEAGQIMLFARAIGDPNPIYADAAYAATTEVGSVIAPPTFVQSSAQYDPTYRVRPKFGEPWFGSGARPSGVEGWAGGDGRLHAEQHFEYVRPLRAGDVLYVSGHQGDSWTKTGSRGLLSFQETVTEYRDQDGELVVKARAIVVTTSDGRR